MPRDKFKEILRYPRFDIRSKRSERIKIDKFALISVIWDRFVDNCQALFIPHENVTIDEQFPITQYMESKSDKFGIKFWMVDDIATNYFVNGHPYLGKVL